MNFDSAKENMIKNQILPQGVPLGSIIDAIVDIPRECFLPEDIKPLAYSDSGFNINGRVYKDPVLLARMINELMPAESEDLLKLGLESGYELALVSKICASVNVVDYDQEYIDKTKKTLESLSLNNITYNSVDYLDNMRDKSIRFSRIYVSNPIKENDIDRDLLNFLSIGGKMVYMIEKPNFYKVFVANRISEGTFKSKFVFDVYKK